jgi:hypothetical protein
VNFFKIRKNPYRKWNCQFWLEAISELEECFNQELIIADNGAILYNGLTIGEAY